MLPDWKVTCKLSVFWQVGKDMKWSSICHCCAVLVDFLQWILLMLEHEWSMSSFQFLFWQINIATPQIRCKMEHPHMGLIQLGFEVTLFNVTELVAASPVIHKQQRTLPRRATNQRQGHWHMQHDLPHLLDHHMGLECLLFQIEQHELSLQNSHSQVDDKSATRTPILHAEAERGLCWGILSRTSLKHHNHFGSFLKLTTFICKQLKMHVAFSVVQRGVDPRNLWTFNCITMKSMLSPHAKGEKNPRLLLIHSNVITSECPCGKDMSFDLTFKTTFVSMRQKRTGCPLSKHPDRAWREQTHCC